MEKRARELHRVIGLADQAQWRKFITENYTQALIDKPLRSQVAKGDRPAPTPEKTASSGNLEGKVSMFQRLHNDFGDSKIVKLKPDGEKLEMELSGSELSGVFSFVFSTEKPYLIDGLRVQAEAGNR